MKENVIVFKEMTKDISLYVERGSKSEDCKCR
jgi:hypothetical protein